MMYPDAMLSSTGGRVWFALDENGFPEGVSVLPEPEHDHMACPACGEPWFAGSIMFTPDGQVEAFASTVACLTCGCIIELY